MFTLRRSAWIRWLPPIESESPSPVTTQTVSRTRRRETSRNRRRATVDRVHAVRLHVVREPSSAADPRDEHDLLPLQVQLRHEALHRSEDRVVTQPGHQRTS